MLFNSYVFILLYLPIVLVVYFLFNKVKKYALSKVWLLVASMFFCAWINYWYLIILCFSILVNYSVYYVLQRRRTITFCTIGILANIIFLVYFKYCNFFLENINSILNTDFNSINVILPLGISFYTFQQIAFLVDCYKDSTIQYSFLDYCLYICYFPKLSQGPMAYHHELISQFNDLNKKSRNDENIARGLYLFAIGLGKKIFLADTLAGIVSLGYEHVETLSTLSALVVTLSYTLQIYFDFSGYCDMAAGVSYMFNIELPLNFDLPYQARSVSQFWKRWHMTLTRFFTKYIYIPLGGSRAGIAKTCINTMIVFTISGIWHGAAWTFIIWGIIHGILLVFERLTGRFIERVPVVLGQITTLGIVNIAWIFFRAESLTQASRMIKRIFAGGLGGISMHITEYVNETVEASILCNLDILGVVNKMPEVLLILLLVFALIFVWHEKNIQKELSEIVLTRKKSILTIVILTWGILSLAGHSEFIYFNF